MLVLSRRVGEKLVIRNDIWVTVVAVKGNSVRVGIDAPEDVRILRSELACCQEAVAGDQPANPPSREKPDANGDAIVRLATASTREVATLRRRALEIEGIRCPTVTDHVGGVGIIPPLPELWVYRADVERAQTILNGLQNHRAH